MTWVRFERDWVFRNLRYSEYFKAGDWVNRPRHVADAAEKSGAAVKEVKKREKSGAN